MTTTYSTRHAAIWATVLLPALLGGCAPSSRSERSATPLGLYRNLAARDARVDSTSAQEMMSSYRRNHGLPGLALDPGLQRLAESEAAGMASSGRPSSAEAVKARMRAAGYRDPGADLSAGYQTLAEAFSGWRDSPGHNRVMLASGADRMGIATAYAPDAKYHVFWVLLVAKSGT